MSGPSTIAQVLGLEHDERMLTRAVGWLADPQAEVESLWSTFAPVIDKALTAT